MAEVLLSKVSVWMYHQAGDTFTITANLYAVDGGGAPTGASLGSKSLNESDIDEAPGSMVDFTFSPSITIDTDTEYALVFTSDAVSITGHGAATQDPNLADIKGALYVSGAGWSGKIHRIRSQIYIDGALNLDNDSYSTNTSYGLQSTDFITYNFGLFFTVEGGLDKAVNPVPADTASGVRKGTTQISWDAVDGATSYDVYFGEAGSMAYVGNVAVNYLSTILAFSYATNYVWRVDPRNDDGVTEGDEWTFSTEVFAPPVFNIADPNVMVTQRRLLVAADNKLFYET